MTDLQKLKPLLNAVGLELSPEKCELLQLSPSTKPELIAALHQCLPKVKTLSIGELTLLRSPIHATATKSAINRYETIVNRMCSRIKLLDSHSGLFFLTHHTAAPRLNYLLRTSPLYEVPQSLKEIDAKIHATAMSVTNVDMDGEAWRQASLPVRFGGLGLRSVGSLALPCYLSSMNKSQELVNSILGVTEPRKSSAQVKAERFFQQQFPDTELPTTDAAARQKTWDELICQKEFANLKNSANQIHSARLLAAASPHSGAWLQALPSSALGLHLDDETVRISVALRLGSQVCEPHRCRCGKFVNNLGHHGLSCRFSAGRLPRHYHINDVVKRSLAAAGIPSWLEPVGLDRGDGRRPDGLTVFPFTDGKNLCWDSTCHDTFCKTALKDTALSAGAAANKAEADKRRQYASLQGRYRFEPLAIETSGVFGKTSAKLVSEIGRRIAAQTGDKRETAWLRQRLSIAVVRGNAASVLATGNHDG